MIDCGGMRNVKINGSRLHTTLMEALTFMLPKSEGV
jgi:hypothetical protein